MRETVSPDGNFLSEADHAEKVGDRNGAASKLRAHLLNHPGDGAVRLRLARMLLALGEPTSARQVLQPLDGGMEEALAAEANRLLAALDEGEGALTSAQIRWERCLADDIDDLEARAHLRLLRPQDEERWPSNLPLATLVSPEGVQTSRFKLIRELGRGASATVYLVRDERLALPLALKVLHPQLAATSRSAAREKFFDEARMAARLRHPGVVAIYGIDETARCLAMEFIAGGTLRDRLRAAGENVIDAHEIQSIARSMLGALAYVHAADIVHGDIKPGNILLRGPTEVVLADFGVAEFANAVSAAGDERPAGTPLYLAPEQFRGAPPSTATDCFAAGAILWELVHDRPVRRQSDLMMGDHLPIAAIQTERLTPLGVAGTRLTAIIDALLKRDPTQRPNAATALSLLD